MGNPIGSVSIEVLANIANLVSDLGKAQAENAKAAREMQRQWQDAGDKIKETLRSALEVVGISASVAGLKELVSQSLEAAARVRDMSQSIGASTQTIQTLSYAAGVSGSSLDLMSTALQKLEKSAVAAASGSQQDVEAFRAIGISAQQVAQLMRDPDQLIRVVTAHLAQFADGSGKTAVAMQLMGRGAAANIPLINKLGKEYDNLQAHARAVGVVLSTEQTKALADTQEKVNELGQDVKGLANQFTVEMLPAISAAQAQLDEFVNSDGMKVGIQTIGAGLENVVTHLGDIKQIAQTITAGGLPTFLGDAASEAATLAMQSGIVYDVFVKIRDVLPSLSFDWIGKAEKQVKDLGARAAAAIAGAVNTVASGSDSAGWAKLQIQIDAALRKVTEDSEQAAAATDDFGLHLRATGQQAEDSAHKQINYNARVNESAAAQQAAARSLQQMEELLDSISSKTGDQYSREWQSYNATLDKVAARLQDVKDKHGDVAKAEQIAADATALLNSQMQAQGDAQQQLDLVLQRAQADYNEHIRLSGLSIEQQKIEEQYTRLLTEADKALLDVMGPLTQAEQDRLNGLHRVAEGMVKVDEATENSKRVLEDYRNIYQQGLSSIASTVGQFFSGQIKNWHDFGQSLVGGVKQMIGAIIEEFLKLQFINPLLNAVFGGSLGLLPTAAGAAGLGGGGAGGGGGLGVMDILGGANSAYGAYGWLTGSGGSQSVMGSITGTGEWDANLLGGYGGGSALGVGATALGIYGGYRLGSQLTGSSAGGVAGAGAVAVASYFVPIVGWIMGALTLIDMATGGGLFGTDANKLAGGGQSVNIGAGGASVASHYTMKGKKPLFGGSYYEEHSYVDQQALDAWNQFFRMLKTSNENFAKQLGVDAGTIAAGSFAQTFDKKGNITGSTTTIAGHTYSGETAQQFQEREIAETMIATMSQLDSKLSGSIDKYRANADQLLAITQALAQGAAMMKGGEDFLALGSDQSVTHLLALAETMQQFGETIDQTIQRIEQAQAQYDQFVGQFKVVTYVDSFEGALAQVKAQMDQNIATANALAKAAGAEGASEKDLANIRAYAQKQTQDLIAQLQQQSQALAFSMGLSNIGTLDQVNQEIARLEGKANAGGSAVQRFGNAMSDAAQKAKDAYNLMLGNLSPFNDQQKIEIARQGLMRGSVSQDQFLEVARRLYGTSQKYLEEFRFAQQYPGGGGAGAGPVGTHNGLSGADRERLSKLYKEQADLQKQAQYQNALTLSQMIADQAALQKVDWHQIADKMGLDVAGLEKILGKNDQQFNDYITSLEEKTDSQGNSISSLIDAIYALIVQLGGTGPGDGSRAPPGEGHSGHARPGAPSPPPPPSGHSGHGIPTPRDFARAFVDALRTASVPSRNLRLGRG
jgi:hypothetical protein